MGDEDTGQRPPEGSDVREGLARFAELIRRLEDEERTLEAIPLLLKKLGDLRALLFSYEVRTTERLLPVDDPQERESRRIVREALERRRRMIDEWESGEWSGEEE